MVFTLPVMHDFEFPGVRQLVLWLVQTESDRTEQREHAQKVAEQTVREKIANAKTTAGDVLRVWEVRFATDPASGEKVPRYASVWSDSGLCQLEVQQRIDGTRLSSIYCSGFKISPYDDIEVKFDNRSTSDTMRIQTFSDGDDVYIPIDQYDWSGHLSYKQFLRRLARANKVSLLLTMKGAGQHWTTFSLRGSSSALTKIGAFSG